MPPKCFLLIKISWALTNTLLYFTQLFPDCDSLELFLEIFSNGNFWGVFNCYFFENFGPIFFENFWTVIFDFIFLGTFMVSRKFWGCSRAFKFLLLIYIYPILFKKVQISIYDKWRKLFNFNNKNYLKIVNKSTIRQQVC